MAKKRNRPVVHGKLHIALIGSQLGNGENIAMSGSNINNKSLRLQLFGKTYRKHRKIECVSCGAEATHISIESTAGERPHFNLRGEGGLLFTKDHILPKSKCGPDKLYNLQVMCTKCNGQKDNKLTLRAIPILLYVWFNKLKKEIT